LGPSIRLHLTGKTHRIAMTDREGKVCSKPGMLGNEVVPVVVELRDGGPGVMVTR